MKLFLSSSLVHNTILLNFTLVAEKIQFKYIKDLHNLRKLCLFHKNHQYTHQVHNNRVIIHKIHLQIVSKPAFFIKMINPFKCLKNFKIRSFKFPHNKKNNAENPLMSKFECLDSFRSKINPSLSYSMTLSIQYPG